MLGAYDCRGMSYTKQKFERKQLRLWICRGLKIPIFSHIALSFCIIEEKNTDKLP